jgi:hypothetical protein
LFAAESAESALFSESAKSLVVVDAPAADFCNFLRPQPVMPVSSANQDRHEAVRAMNGFAADNPKSR